MRHTCARVLAVMAVAGLLSSPVYTAKGPEPVAPRPLAEYNGLSPGEWLAVWWQEVFATATDTGQHPLVEGGAFGGKNGVVFLGGPVMPAGSPQITRRVTVTTGTHLFVPVITVECSEAEADVFHAEGEAALRACANGLLDEATDLEVRIDGRLLTHPAAYRVESPLFRYGPLTAENFLGLPPATQSDALGAGYALLLPPFSKGLHRVAVRASVPAFGIAVDQEYIITVRQPGK